MGWQFCQSFNYSYSGSVKRTPIIEGANKVEFRNNINGFASEGHARKFQYWNYSATESELKQLARSEIQNYGVFNPHDRVIC
jgi:hypothetical protein